MAGIYKAYDIRGIYPEQLDEQEARDIGVAVGNLLAPGTVVVGHDMRDVAVPIAEHLIRGLRDTGQHVIDIGLCSTPMNYNAIAHYGAQGGVMVTASHNPSEYIGFKISREDAKAVAYETGINQIEQAVNTRDLPVIDDRGTYEERDFLPVYTDRMLSLVGELDNLHVAVDTGNGMGGLEVPPIYDQLPIRYEPMYFELDGTFPNHTPNPIERENMEDLQEEVRSGEYDLGIAFDGDGDRVAFVDEVGDIVPSDLLTALLSRPMLESSPGSTVVYDLRSSRVVPEEIRANGGEPVRHRVGHAYMKAKMRETDACLGGELSGHYYFRETSYTDCGVLASLVLLQLLSSTGQSLSELIRPLRRYAQSGEVNFEVENKREVMETLADHYEDAEVDWLDGVSVRYEDWWFNVRPSNTEPYLRLNLEAPTEEACEEKLQAVTQVIESHVSA